MSSPTTLNPKRARKPAKEGSWRAFMDMVADSRKSLDRETMRMNNQFVNGVRAIIVSQIASLLALANITFAVLATLLIMISVVFVYVLATLLFPLYKWRVFKHLVLAEVQAQDTSAL